MAVEGYAELALGIAALVYGVGLALFRLPMLQVRRWGWTAMMHSWSGVAVFTILGSLSILKGLMAPYVSELGYGWALAATFDDAVESAKAARDMAFAWVSTVNLAAVTLGSLQSLLMLALLPAWISGVGVLLSAIASYIFGAVFGTLIFMQKILAGVILFMEGVVAFVGLMKVLAPAMFYAGLVLFMIPFARRAGKTFMVLGAVLTLALPVAIVAASPPPGYAERKIMEAADLQAVSIASKAVSDLEGGARYAIFDRENDSLWYPFLLGEPQGEPVVDRDKVCGNIPRGANVTCDQLVEMVREVLKTPEKAILDTGGGGYYNAYRDGYRIAMTNNTFARRVWFLNMWVVLHDKSPKNITVKEIPDKPDRQAMECALGGGYYDDGSWVFGHGGGLRHNCDNLYRMWRDRWEQFWEGAEFYNETSEWMIAENRNSTFVWFTEQPWGTPKEEWNKYEVKVEKKRESHWEECDLWVDDDNDPETPEVCARKRYYTQAYYQGNKSVYFVYLNMSDTQVCWTFIINGNEVRHCETRKGAPDWTYKVYDFRGPKEKYPPNQIDIRDERFRHNATIGGYVCNVEWHDGVFDSHFEEIKKEGFIEDYGPYSLEQSVQAVDRDEPLVLDAPTEEKKVVVEVEVVCTAWSYAGYPILPELLTYEFRVDFTASDSMPYLPPVDWDKFDDDDLYTRRLAAGDYVPDTITIGGTTFRVDSVRREWARYQNFRQGLYRDGPAHEAMRRVNAKLLEYKEKSWESNATVFDTGIPFAKSVSDIVYKSAYGAYAGSSIPISSHRLIITQSGSVGILKPLSELVGQSFAIGLAIGLIALVIDTFQAFVGGQSLMVGFLMGKVGNISASANFFAQFSTAVRRLAGASVLGRTMARRMENQLLKAALEQRRLDGKQWDKMAASRKLTLRERAFERIVGRERLERMLDSRNPLERMAARGYALSVAMEGLKDPGFKKAVERQMAINLMEKRGLASRVDLFQDALREFKTEIPRVKVGDVGIKTEVEKNVRGLSQSGGSRMTPTQWAEGFAAMMKNPDVSRWEKVVLADSFARSNPGRDVVKALAAEPVGKAVEGLGERLEGLGVRAGSEGLMGAGRALEHIGRGFDGHITAPAAFGIGGAEPWVDNGVRVSVPQGYVPYGGADWRAFGSEADAVVRRNEAGGDLSDVQKAVGFVEVFGSSEDYGKVVNDKSLQHLMETASKPDPERFNQPFQQAVRDDLYLVDVRVNVPPDVVEQAVKNADPESFEYLSKLKFTEDGGAYVTVTHVVEGDKLHEFREEMEKHGHRVDVNSIRSYSDARKEDSQPVQTNPNSDVDSSLASFMDYSAEGGSDLSDYADMWDDDYAPGFSSKQDYPQDSSADDFISWVERQGRGGKAGGDGDE